jgi:alkylation response protein AidB-like acyl-CoA dehydrogenase
MLTEEQKELIALVKEMAENEIKPFVKEADTKGECPPELYEWGYKIGLHLVEVPKEHGGLGLSYETTALIFEELAKVDAGYAITFVTTFVALRNVVLAGTPEQARYFADMVKQKKFAAFALTEQNAGTEIGRAHV